MRVFEEALVDEVGAAREDEGVGWFVGFEGWCPGYGDAGGDRHGLGIERWRVGVV